MFSFGSISGLIHRHSNWAIHPQRPTFSHFTPLPVNDFFFGLFKSYSQSAPTPSDLLKSSQILSSSAAPLILSRCARPILILSSRVT
jgi:hypothetical protein